MLQPRRRKFLELSWLLLVGLSLHQVTCDLGSDGLLPGGGRVRAERVGRDENDVNTVLLLDNNGRNGRYLATAVPVVTSTARTFVQEGTTTEFATHVIGTRLDKGKLYASVVGTSSRVYYDTHLPRYNIDNQILPTNPRIQIRPTAHLVYPAKEARVPFSSLKSGLVYQTAINSEPHFTQTLNEPNPVIPVFPAHHESHQDVVGNVKFSSQSSSSKHVDKKQKEFDVEEDNYLVSPNQDLFKKRNVEESHNSITVNPAHVVKPIIGLPTFTIKHDFAPSGFSADVEEEETTEGRRSKERIPLRGGKALYRNGVKTDNRKLDTVTYRGFADFTTTVGDTVIIFMPNTASSEASKATISIGTSSSAIEDQFKVVTKMKTFYSHTPGMQTKTVTGHSLSMQTTLPTHLILPENGNRRVKAFSSSGPVHVVEAEAATEQQPEVETPQPPNVVIEPSMASVKSSFTTSDHKESVSATEQLPSVVGSRTTFFPTVTEPLATYATTRTQVLAAADQKEPLGLVKVLGGTRAFNSTTTLFTALIYGTIIDGTYSQVIHSTSSVFYAANSTAASGTTAVPEVTTESEEVTSTTENVSVTGSDDISTNMLESTTPLNVDTLNNAVETGRKINTRPQNQLIVENNANVHSEDRKNMATSEINAQEIFSTNGYLTRLIPTTSFKTFTYLTTFFIPDGLTTTTSVRSRQVTSSEVNFITRVVNGNVDSSSIVPTAVQEITTTKSSLETDVKDLTTNVPTTEKEIATNSVPEQTTEYSTTETEKITTEKTTTEKTTTEKTTTERLVEDIVTVPENPIQEEQVVTTESEEITITTPTPTPTTPAENEEEEIDLIFKTLYTTYTYLTTFFQESTTSVSSREVVVTNIVTSTLDRDFFLQTSDSAVAGLFARDESLLSTEVMPTSVGIGRPTTQYFSEFDSDQKETENELQPSQTPIVDEPELSEVATKTFYTTYTYFTTIFVDGETTISSRTEVYTNVVTPSSILVSPTVQDIVPTRSPSADYFDQVEAPQSQVQVSGIFEQLEASHARTPILKSTPHYAYSSTITRNRYSSRGVSSKDIQSSISSDNDSDENDNNVVPQHTPKIKDGYATISRSHSNDPTAAAFEGTTVKSSVTSRDAEDDGETTKESSVTEDSLMSDEPNMDMRAAVLAHEQSGEPSKEHDEVETSVTDPSVTEAAPEIQGRLDTFFAGDEIEPSTVSDESIVMKTMAMVTDITSSSSGGNAVLDALDDQISSESNTEEIEPSPALLLQTSFTTFTYFTTVYKGSTSSEVISRLETVTNVVTETLSPTRSSIAEEDSTLPITYFTTFTYWTTLYRDGNTVVTSREETVSNIITPTVALPPVLITATKATELESIQADLEPSLIELESSQVELSPSSINVESTFDELESSAVDPQASLVESNKTGPTTYYTTYTYFTTSYIGNSTLLNSRLETVTNIVNETDNQIGRAIGTSIIDQLVDDKISKTEAASLPTGLLSTIFTSEVQDGTTTLFSTDVYGSYINGLYAKILESSTQIVTDTISSSSTIHLQPTGVLSLNEGQIIDADGVSTTYFTTKAIGTYIEQLYAQVIESTSSIKVDEEKKTALPSTEGDKNLKTGLVRLIEGSIVKDDTTTFYESKVVGTVIDGQYAQIIESTSSFKVSSPSTKTPEVILATSAVLLDQAVTGTVLTTLPSSAVIESSLGEEGTEEDEEEESDDEDDDDNGDGSLKKPKKSRLTFSTRKRTFTPVIRPFASRNRPTFNPRRKTADASSATTITRTTLTPTITATPAAKSSEGRGRFASNRRQSSALNEIRPTSSASSKRFSRVRGSTPGVGAASFSSPSLSRGRSTTRVFPTATASVGGLSRRGGFYRSSSTRTGSSDFPQRSTSGASSLRFRIRPTSSGFGRGASTSATTPSPDDQFSPDENDITTLMTEETPLFTDDEQDSPTQPISTTTESSRRTNPLLRFRRPPTLRSQSTTQRPVTTTSPRRNPLLRRTSESNNNNARTTTTSTTSKPATSFNSRFKNLSNNRQRPSNSLFPRRGLLKKPEEEIKEEQKVIEKEEYELQKDEGEEEIADNDYEGSEVDEAKTEATPRKSKALSPQIRPFVGFQRRRSKRQTSEYGARRESTTRAGYNPRFRRPTSSSRAQSQVQERIDDVEDEPITEAPRNKAQSRFTPRSRSSQPTQQKIRSTTASSNANRSPFTLRENTTPRASFRRPTTPSLRRTSVSRSKDTSSSRQQAKTPRLRSQSNPQADTNQFSRTSSRRFSNSNSNSRRPQSRSRSRGDTTNYDSYTYYQPNFDGTITVTHRVPTEVTIPVVNGKVTEYRNVITASASTEVLGPHQYTTTSGKDGSTVLLLTSEVTGTLPGGITEITQYVLHETPTTSITFTPTTIRGRKTSYSHIVPSTVYDVERLVSTIQPHLSPNAPLANILLSQLLLGNLNLAQPNINPLLALNPTAAPATPVTEFKTSATTYVTTVTKGTSTILPLTFRGKEILTTIHDTSLETITATEFITETIVTTPTAAVVANQQQLNSLLLPALLQAQLLQSQGQQNTQNPLFGLQQLQEQKVDEVIEVEENTRLAASSRRRRPEDPDRSIRDSEKEFEDEDDTPAVLEEEPPAPRFKSSRKKPSRSQLSDKKPPDLLPNLPATSIITLYVSGRRPGEFSTVLSTVVVDDDNSATIKKREVEFAASNLFKVESSTLRDLDNFFPMDQGYLENTILFSMNDIPIESSGTETQSLESIVGDVSKYNKADEFSTITQSDSVAGDTEVFVKAATKSDETTGHFLSKGPAEFAPLKRKVVIELNGGSDKGIKRNEEEPVNAYTNERYLIRNIRSIDESEEDSIESIKTPSHNPRRVRVRVPIARRISDDSHHGLTPSESQQTETDIDHVHNQQFGLRRIKIIRGSNRDTNIENGEDRHQKRVVVRRRKPVDDDTHKTPANHEKDIDTIDQGISESYFPFSTSLDLVPTHSHSSHRRKITITKKRVISQPTLLPSLTSSHHRRRIVVTKKRPLSTLPIISPTESMVTLFSYMYTVGDQNGEEPQKKVSVAQVFMSGNIPKEFEQQPNEESIEDEVVTEIQTDPELLNILPQLEPSVIPTSFDVVEMVSTIPPSESAKSLGFIEPSVSSKLPETEEKKSERTETIDDATVLATPSLEESTIMNITTEAILVITTETSTETTPETTFDGPRFIRPTRFSITRKPSRTKASFPGGRRKTTETQASTQNNKVSTTKSTIYPTISKQNNAKFTTSSHKLATDKQSSKSYRPSKSRFYGKPSKPSIPSTSIHLERKHEKTADLSASPTDLSPLPIITPSYLAGESEVNLFVTRLVTRTRLRTYTYIVTRVAGSEEVVTSSTEVKPHVTTLTLTQSVPVPDIQETARDDRALNLAEARYNLATKVMSNGVEVIVAGDKSTLPGETEILRVLTSSPTRPTTLAASTLTDHMMMLLPQKVSQADLSSLGNKFVTKTYLTTYTYLQTSVSEGTTDISQQEYIVSNTATEERLSSTPALAKDVTLMTRPILATGVFHTTYTFLNTIIDEDVPLVFKSTKVVDNTLTAPVNELTQAAQMETNIYYSTLDFTKTVTEGGVPQVLSTKNMLTQKVITQATPQTTIETPSVKGSTVDVVKTYFVTYTYLNTYLEDGNTVVSSDVSISTDIVTEKFYLNPKRTSIASTSHPSNIDKLKDESTKPHNLFATKTYLTTFTYFTTLLQEGTNHKTSTLISSHTSVVQNIVTESVSSNLIRSEAPISLQDSQKLTVTEVENLQPTKTAMPDDSPATILGLASSMEDNADNSNIDNIVTGSTIIFFDENDQIDTQASQVATPALDIANLQQALQTTILNAPADQGPVNAQPLTSQILQDDVAQLQVEGFQTSVLADSTITSAGNTLMPGDEVIMLTQSNGNISMIPVSDPVNKKPNGGSFGPGGSEIQVSDLLSLGSLGINGLNALGPVINAMAGLIQSNLHDHTRRNDSVNNAKPNFSYLDANGNPRPVFVPQGERTTPRSPIYIPVGGLAEDVETAESVNQESWSDAHARHPSEGGNSVVLGRPSLESPLLSDGIAISPGQVITANSDVIVGKPGLLGPRPPKINSEKEIPAGMRPPPPPRPKRPTNEQYFGPPPALDQVGHQSVNDHSAGPPPPKRENQASHGPIRNHVGGSTGGHQLVRDQSNRPSFTNGHPLPVNRDHQLNHPQSPPKNPQFQGNSASNNHNIESDLNPPPIANNLPSFHGQHETLVHTPPIGAGIIVHPPILNENHYIITNNPLSQDIGQFPVSSGVQAVFGGQPQPNDIIHGKIPTGSHVLDSSAGQPLLVNIQPSQVANVIIKDGSPTAVPFGDIEEDYVDRAPFPVQDNRPTFVDSTHDNGHQQHHFVGPVGSVHQTRMDPPPNINIGVGSHLDQVGSIDNHAQGINVDIAPGQGINVDVSPGHSVNVGHVVGTEHISPSGIVLDEPLNGRPSSNEISFGRPNLSNSRRPQRPSQFNGPSRPRLPTQHRHQPHNPNHVINHFSNGHNPDPNHVSHDQNQASQSEHMNSNSQNYPKIPIEFMVPPPLPPKSHFTNQPILIPLNSDSSNANEPNDDHLFTDDDDNENSSIESEGGELIQASNSRPLRPGQLPKEIENSSTRRPQPRPIASVTPEVFMRPPEMPVSNINVHQVFDKRPIRPAENKPSSFDVVVQPQGNFGRPQIFDENPQVFFEEQPNLTNFDERHEVNNQGPASVSSQERPHSEDIHKNPPNNFKRPDVPPSYDSESQSNTPRPFSVRPVMTNQVDRESVVGLSPPPEPQSAVVKIGNQRRPPHSNTRNKTRPVAPYKFEVPPSTSPNVIQPSHPPVQEILTVSETNSQQSQNQKQNNDGYKPDNVDRKPPRVDYETIKAVTIRPPQIYRPKTIRPIAPTQQSVHTLKTSVVKPKPLSTAASPALQTVVIVGKPIHSNPPSIPSSPQKPNRPGPWDGGKIVGSETIFLDQVIQPTPSVIDFRNRDPTSKPQTTSAKTIYGNLFTRPSNVLKPTRVLGSSSINDQFVGSKETKLQTEFKQSVEIPTRYITHTKTLTVTLTETTVVSSEGHRPSTRTIVVTKTQTSTLVDTVTQIHTLVKPTEIRATATVTTTVSAIQYPPGSPFDPANYPQFPVKMVPNDKVFDGTERIVDGAEKVDKNGGDSKKPIKKLPEENDTFFVVVNDKKLSSVNVKTQHKDTPVLTYEIKEEEIASRDETDSNNEVNRAVLLGGVLVAAPPPRHGSPASSPTACRPDCSPARNELCQRVSGHMRCVCRPGFARMFPDRPCKPTYTYTLRLELDRQGNDALKFDPTLKDTSSSKFRALAEASREGLDRLVMQSDLRDIYHGVAVDGFQPAPKKDGVLVNFYVQLSDNADEAHIKDVFKKSLRTSNFSLGGTEVYANKELVQHLQAEDFDECVSPQFHDCSEHSHCFNLHGTYTCSCKEGFADLSENSLFPGRVCSAELIGCEKCHYHGTCYSRGDEQLMCECFQWYSGENCHVNLKVLLIALVTIGAMLLALLLVCAVLTCMKRNRIGKPGKNAPGFLRYRGPPRTLDKRAMIADSSSEGSVDNGPVTFLAPTHQPANSIGSKPALKGARKLSENHHSGTMISVGYGDQRDRSLTVMIPRAKYRPVPPTSPHLSMSTFGVEENRRAIVQEQKLFGYLEHGVQLPQDNRNVNTRRKQSNITSHSSEFTPQKKVSAPRKPSTGALVSAGFEVSATVGRKEEMDIEIMTSHNTLGSQFPAMRPAERTVSEARSCDETTVQPPTKSFHGQSQYGSKPSSRNRDEAHTMAERDLGSTLLMPQTHLYRPDRGSDISNFDSL